MSQSVYLRRRLRLKVTGPLMKAKIGILQDLTPPIQTGRHILMILKTELAVTTITTLPQETILTNSVEPKWATTDFFKTLALSQAKA